MLYGLAGEVVLYDLPRRSLRSQTTVVEKDGVGTDRRYAVHLM